MSNAITSLALMDKFCAALDIDPAMVGRIVIDMDTSNYGPLKVWVMHIGSEKLLEIELPEVKDADITMVGE